jgi:hypothetical protein
MVTRTSTNQSTIVGTPSVDCRPYFVDTKVDKFNTSKSLFGSKLVEGAPVSPHVIKMIGYIESLQRLGFALDDDLATDVILQSLPASFEPFIMNYHMNGFKKTLT